jgi:hypothetical protein
MPLVCDFVGGPTKAMLMGFVHDITPIRLLSCIPKLYQSCYSRFPKVYVDPNFVSMVKFIIISPNHGNKTLIMYEGKLELYYLTMATKFESWIVANQNYWTSMIEPFNT